MANVLINIIGKDKFSNVSKKVQSRATRLKNSIRAIGTVGAASFIGIGYAAKKTIDAYKVQEQALARLNASMKNVKTAGSGAADELARYASELQKSTKFGDEQIISAEAMLGTFQLNEKQIKDIVPRLLDMATATEKATGNSADLEQIAIALGKAFTGQPGLLSRYGVVLDDQAIKFEGFDGIIKSLDDNFKGLAKSVANTPTGKLEQLGNVFGDLKEVIGKILLDAIFPMVTGLKNLFEWFIKLPDTVQKMTLAIVGSIAILKIFSGTIATLFPAMGPVGWVITGVGLAASLFYAFSDNTNKAEQELKEFNIAIANMNLTELTAELETVNKKMEEANASVFGGVSKWDFFKASITGLFQGFRDGSSSVKIISNLFKEQEEVTTVLQTEIDTLHTKIKELTEDKAVVDGIKNAMEGFKSVEKIDLVRPMELQTQKVIDIQAQSFERLSEMRQMSMEEEVQLLELSWQNISADQKRQLGGEKFFQQRLFQIRKSHNDAFTTLQTDSIRVVGNVFQDGFINVIDSAMDKFLIKQDTIWANFINSIIKGIARAIAKYLALMALKAATKAFGMPFETGGKIPPTAETGMRTTGMDLVPVLAQPGEQILPRRVVEKNPEAVDNLMSGKTLQSGGGAGKNYTFNINTIDANGVKEFIESDAFKEALIDQINYNDIKLTTKQSGEQISGVY